MVDTPVGKLLVKLRGAAQGTGALVAEMVVAALAEALDLPVLERHLVWLEDNTPTDDKNDELADLLEASVGLNLAFPFLEKARDASAREIAGFSSSERAAILWLDRLVLNPDRTNRNPNILWNEGRLCLIDHGSALRFQYDWPGVTEVTPREVGAIAEPHIFEEASTTVEWDTWDAVFAERIARPVLENALAAVPENFLIPLLAGNEHTQSATLRNENEEVRRRRAAYVAFLWKRLRPPRAFANQPPQLHVQHSGKGPPRWLTDPFNRGIQGNP